MVTYTPADIGTYNVSVNFGGKPVPNAPFKVTTQPTGDASRVKIPGQLPVRQLILTVVLYTERQMVIFRFLLKESFLYKSFSFNARLIISDGIRTTIPVGEECVININTAEAGYGNVTCHIHSTSGCDVDIDIVDNGDGTVSLMYTPRLPGAYTLNIKFGGQPVPDGQILQQVCIPGLQVKQHYSHGLLQCYHVMACQLP